MPRLTSDILCQKAAVLSDIHSNYHAFRACFADALRNGADCFLFLGDYISDLSQARETLDLVYEIKRNYPTVCLRGNRERYMLEHKAEKTIFSRGSKTGSLLYTYQQLTPTDLAFFEEIPSYDRITLNSIPFEIAHAIAGDDRFYFENDDTRIRTVFSQMHCPYLLTGHAHKQYRRQLAARTIINPGSVGIPQGGSLDAQYALLDVSAQEVRCQLRQVPYDIAAVIHAQFESGLVTYAPCWAVSILYDIITGEEYTMKLLELVRASGSVVDEDIWRSAAIRMGMRFSESEILALLRTASSSRKQV